MGQWTTGVGWHSWIAPGQDLSRRACSPAAPPTPLSGKDAPITATLLAPAPAAEPTSPTLPDPAIPDLFVARRDLESLLGTWLNSLDVDQLCGLSSLCEQRMSGIFTSRLLDSLRWEAVLAVVGGEAESRSPVTMVRFGTSTYDNGVFYADGNAEFVHADGTVSTLDCGDRVAEYLADLSSVDYPYDGDTLTVDLVTARLTS